MEIKKGSTIIAFNKAENAGYVAFKVKDVKTMCYNGSLRTYIYSTYRKSYNIKDLDIIKATEGFTFEDIKPGDYVLLKGPADPVTSKHTRDNLPCAFWCKAKETFYTQCSDNLFKFEAKVKTLHKEEDIIFRIQSSYGAAISNYEIIDIAKSEEEMKKTMSQLAIPENTRQAEAYERYRN